MINQPEPVFSFTIPYYTSSNGETDELFVSEKTYEKYLLAVTKTKVIVIHGTQHPISSIYGEVTTTLFDNKKSIIVIGTKDLDEYTSELIDIAIAQELEKIVLMDRNEFFRFLYDEATPDPIKIFIDDFQQTVEEIHITKRLKKEGYRIHEREALLAEDILANAIHFTELRNMSPLENEHGVFLLTKLIYLHYSDRSLYQQYKIRLQPNYQRLFIEAEKLLSVIQKMNLSTAKGRERAIDKVFQYLNYKKHVKKITLNNIEEFHVHLRV
ncbi:hypothetical protein BKP37_13580 [Anaerobacillus alkalilacustris]|uniref:Uncharacterized protein n=1 Tax=Anaerobacillus alkalilacustris TaxID=393763 RepID=A0A1S2LJI8_9BACI|nr:hypothetical protein [Anaerobacillus alkalilacustris]OIJ12464.1 hypothetical protein BKP37_13580 [Anaerobacillus alkalilacustris]